LGTRIAAALLVILVASSAFAEPRLGLSTTGPIASSKLVALTADGGIALEAAGKRRNYPADKLVLWGQASEPRRGPVIVLADGSRIVAEPIALNSEELRIDSRLLGELALTRNTVRGIVYRLPSDARERDRLFEKIAVRREAGDWLLLANGDELTGRTTGQKSADDENEERLLFAVGQSKEPATLGFSKLAAVAFDSVLIDDSTPRAKHVLAGLRDGSSLVVASTAAKAGRYELALACGLKVRIEDDALDDDITCWQPLGCGVVYLSDLRDAGYKHIPFLTEGWPYHKDRNCHGDRLRAGGAIYAKGLGMRSTSRLAYDLDDDYKQFCAELALDQSAGPRGSVIYRVFTAAEGGAFKSAYESPIIRGGDAPLSIAVDLTGIKRLALIVDFAERGDECDDADWLNARLVK
jgi:hypothetical protein